MDHPFLETIAGLLGDAGVRVLRFEFPYMAARREDGKKRGPNPARILEQTWRDVVAQVREPNAPIYIGGKSMGGRIASMLADDLGVTGLICLGYPFHPPGKPDRLRTAHLEHLETPALFLQGDRDPFGTREEVEGYAISDAVRLAWMEDGDHGFSPRKRAAVTLEQNLERAAEAVVRFMTAD